MSVQSRDSIIATDPFYMKTADIQITNSYEMSILYNENIGCQKYRWSKKALKRYEDYTLQELIQHSPVLEDPETSVLGKSSRLKMKPVGSSHTLVPNNQTTWCQFQEDHNLLH